jgi:hypothetical protein
MSTSGELIWTLVEKHDVPFIPKPIVGEFLTIVLTALGEKWRTSLFRYRLK